jgi:hypothetical protein
MKFRRAALMSLFGRLFGLPHLLPILFLEGIFPRRKKSIKVEDHYT